MPRKRHRRSTPAMPGATSARGYGSMHQKIRARVAPLIASGTAVCARCGEPIRPDEPWDLGHDDENRSRYTGPEHRRCNRSTASHRYRRELASSYSLEALVPHGIVRCGLCGWLIEKGHEWELGGYGPQHAQCEHVPRHPPPFAPRVCSRNW